MSCLSKYNIQLFSGLNQEQLSKLERASRIKQYNKGHVLFLEGEESDVFYIVLKGEIKVSRVSPGGKEKILKIMGKGEYFGEMGVLESKRRSASAEVISSQAVLLILEGDSLKRLIKENPEIALKIIATLSERLRLANHEIENLAFRDVEGRLKDLFFRMARQGEKYAYIDKRITHEEIGKFIGTSRETVTRIVNKLQNRGLIEVQEDIIILKDIKKW